MAAMIAQFQTLSHLPQNKMTLLFAVMMYEQLDKWGEDINWSTFFLDLYN